jgi:uncharacterized protein with von Willebrand factor type A (vWA) domain
MLWTLKKLLALSSFCLNRLGSALKQASQGPRLRPTVEPGSKVERALAREVALFGTKAKTLQAYKLVNNQIMCRKPKGVSNHGGAIIVLIDISDSMNMNINIDGFGNSRRIEAAQAIAFSIMRFAQKQKRRIEIVTFNTYANKLNDQQKEILAFKQLNCNGGTINDVAISEAKRIIHDEKLNEPTIINITDGFVGEIREDTKNMNMYTVVIEFGASPSNLEDKSNKIFRFNEIGDKAFETMAQAFKGL